ncbi:alpha/beta hydrolase [Devosia geojensis]|uniref:alpha/beta hydrolase n=1 Tax=Devosia geojensis TaxID=443610 RepID=UPI00128B2197|nr:alpha/beta fold hydrolase [Devosia geojensis]
MTAGIVFALTALIAAPLAGVEISFAFDETEGQVTWLTLFSGVFLTGCLFWWLLMIRRRRFSLIRGASTGVLIAFFSYPMVLLFAELFQRDWRASADAASLPERFLHVLMLSGLSLLTTGFATTVLFAAVGAVMTRVFLRLHPPSAGTSARRTTGLGLVARRISIALGWLAATCVAVLAGAFLWLSLMPLDMAKLMDVPTRTPQITTYVDAITAIDAVRARETEMPLHPRCLSKLLTHGGKVERVVVFFHGLTNCPAQADELAARFFAMGYNVYIPRLPGHGEADPLTLALADLTAEDLVEVTEESTGLARGLGDDVVVIGLSAGGVMSSWLAQNSAKADVSLSVAPFFGPYVVPAWAARAAANLLLVAPNMMVWWNPLETEPNPEMDYAYPRFATHALGQVMRLGQAVEVAAHRVPPLAPAIGVLLNEADVAVSNRLTGEVIAAWRDHDRQVLLTILPLSHRLPHDVIDPRQEEADIDFVYPILFEMTTSDAIR